MSRYVFILTLINCIHENDRIFEIDFNVKGEETAFVRETVTPQALNEIDKWFNAYI